MSTCQHRLTRGRRRGQRCGRNIYTNREYCRNHYRKYEEIIEEKEEKIDESEIVYDTCSICYNKLFKPKVELECNCKYHLSCYLAICVQSQECISCSDKIFKLEKDYKECTICLEKVVLRDEEYIITKCNHNFHKKCLNNWTRIKNNCPSCRTNL